MMRPLVDPAWLRDNLDRPDLKIIDATWYLPNQNRDGHGEYLEGHIPGAVFFPIDEIADRSSNLPHMLPPADQFSDAASALGFSNEDTIVVYDAVGLFSAPRVWWTLKVFGAQNVLLLDGGLKAWRAAGFALESGEVAAGHGQFHATLNSAAVSDHRAIKQALQSGDRQVLDARSRERFAGTALEPRPELPSGHMPGAKNLPYSELIGADGRLVPEEQIRKVFELEGIDLARPVTTTCGSGVTAAILTLALTAIGHDDLSLYDGSWTEWASRDDCPRDPAGK